MTILTQKTLYRSPWIFAPEIRVISSKTLESAVIRTQLNANALEFRLRKTTLIAQKVKEAKNAIIVNSLRHRVISGILL
jgi:hypothetical protein